tara:strand:+ start:1444 stop:2004 length:561 start_codon:yes stop_codon:yes gene_type:complete
MTELIESAREELKRADHSIYVSLKYTRTVDVIKNTIKRLLSAFDITIVEALEYAKTKKKISDIPTNAKHRALTVSQLFPEIKKSIDFYTLLKKIDRSEYDKREEYRKHVTLITKSLDKTVNVDIETLIKYFENTMLFVEAIDQFITHDVLSLPSTATKKSVKSPTMKKAKKVVKKAKKVVKKNSKK